MQEIFKKTVYKFSFWYNFAFVVALLYLSILIVWLLLVALFNGTDVNTYAANGTFQLYNPLRRLEMGQIIGRDFPFFHGIGVLLLHYPFYWILGGGLFAAETTKWVISPFMFLGSSFVFFYAYSRSFKKSVIATSMVTLLALFAINVFWPGNSLYGVRSTFPVLIMASLVWKTKRSITLPGKLVLHINELVALILLGLSPIFGSEHGVAAIGAYILIQAFIVFRGRKNTPVIRQIGYLLYKMFIICCVSLAAYTILTKGNPVDAIRYAFSDVPTDQGWYFGADPNRFLTWKTLFSEIFTTGTRYIWATILACAACYVFLVRKGKQTQAKIPLLFSLLYGGILLIATTTGYYDPPTQLLGVQRLLAIIVIAVVTEALFSEPNLSRHMSGKKTKYNRLVRSLTIVGIAVFIVLPLTMCGQKYAQIRKFQIIPLLKQAHHAQTQDDYFVASAGWKASIDAFRPFIDPNKKIWSLYTGVYDSTFGNQLNPSSGGEDYIIHALGKSRRAAYETDFLKVKPHYVITLKPNYFVFEEWLWHNHWHIYEDIFTNYSLVVENGTHYLWQRNESSQVSPAQPAELKKVQITNNSFDLPRNETDKPIVYSVNVSYDINTISALTDKLPRYLLSVKSNPKAQQIRISLPSHQKTWDFPVIVMPGKDPVTISSSAEGIMPFANLTINSASYRLTPIADNNLKPFINNICYINETNKIPRGNLENCNAKATE